MINGKPILAITMGDPASIGPEIAVKVLNMDSIYEVCNPVLIGDAKTIERAAELVNSVKEISAVKQIEDCDFNKHLINVYDLENVEHDKFEYGKVSAMCGNAAFESVITAIDLALKNKVDGTVTGPIHKESINLAGHHYSGHTEIYADYTRTKKYAMLLVEENFRVIHVTTHVSLRQACNLVKKDRILEVIDLLNDACKMFGIQNPKIAVAGLNPHASDGGLFGDEEEKEIIPAVREARQNGMIVDGPIPADSLFAKARSGLYDGCVAMYHDQGHIPFKVVGFQWDNDKQVMKSVRGVNITLGLPIIRVSVDHGTAFEIAGRGIASPDALVLAIEYASRMTKNKNSEYHE